MKLTLKDFLGPKGYLAWLIIILFGLFMRWHDLGSRPLHHDESIHAMFGKYFYDFPEVNYYKYNPEYHGPTLYMVLRATYNSIGCLTDAAPRVPIAILGSLMLFLPLLFRQFFKPWSFLFLTAATALSPTLIFWSRFAREDYIILSAMLMVLWGAVKADPKYKVFWIACGIGLNWGTKANVYVFLAQLMGYLLYEMIMFYMSKSSVHSEVSHSVPRQSVPAEKNKKNKPEADGNSHKGKRNIALLSRYNPCFSFGISALIVYLGVAAAESFSNRGSDGNVFIYLVAIMGIFSWLIATKGTNTSFRLLELGNTQRWKLSSGIVFVSTILLVALFKTSEFKLSQAIVIFGIFCSFGILLGVINAFKEQAITKSLVENYRIVMLGGFTQSGLLYFVSFLCCVYTILISAFEDSRAILVVSLIAHVITAAFFLIRFGRDKMVADALVEEVIHHKQIMPSQPELARTSPLILCAVKGIYNNLLHSLLGLSAGVFVYCYFISTGFRHIEGILDGLYRKSIPYWMDKHSIERISGPFSFHLYQLSWYELLFIVAFLVHIVTFYLRGNLIIRLWGAGIAIISFALFMFYDTHPVDTFFLWKFLKLKDHFDVVSAILLLLHPIAVTTYYLYFRRFTLAFWGYFFTANFFTYSYLGEKVPWLSTYILIPGIIFLVLFFQDLFVCKGWDWSNVPFRRVLGVISGISLFIGGIFLLEDASIQAGSTLFFKDSGTLSTSMDLLAFGFVGGLFAYLDAILKYLPTVHAGRFLFGFMCLFMVRMAWLTNFVHQEREIGFISQVHTTREFKAKLEAIRKLSETEMLGRKLKIHVSGEPVWPATWYFKDMPEYQYQDLKEGDYGNYDIILRTWDEKEKVPDGFVAEKINLRGWWVPDYRQMTWKNFFDMAINLRPWSGFGYSYTSIWTNKRILPPM